MDVGPRPDVDVDAVKRDENFGLPACRARSKSAANDETEQELS